MNARLNSIENIELRTGSFFEPVEGERFERVISNPPFVISPASRFVCRDGGRGGDAVSEHVARGAAAHLEEGGYAVLLLNWHHSTSDDWAERPMSWTHGNGCDVRLMRFADEEPLGYAASWLRQEEKRDALSSGQLLDEWLRYYESVGITRLALGAVIMHKRSTAQNWMRCEDISIDISLNNCGEQIERIFNAQDLLQALRDDGELLEHRFKLHPGHRLEQGLAVRDGAWSLLSNKLHITNGMDFCAQADMPTIRFLAELDGTRTVREAAAPIAQSLGRTFEEVMPICLDITKRMLHIGLLMRA
jgi:methylase of polypeptide subunit release factors